ncbi:hypothetical protein MTO96_036930, partial [Rhipicephalus appendiculatus]
RVKVSLGPGRSLMDWIRLTHANPNLSGVNGRFLEVTYEELMKHNKKDDAWICLKGRVYNVTPYMDYHPGGVDELLKGVGKDATDLFNQVHKWVNFESMLEKCLIGKVVGPAVQVRKSSFPVPRIPFIKKLQRTDTATSEDVPDISDETSPKPAVSYEWFQDDSTVTITIQSMGDAIIEEDKVVADLSGKTLRIRIRLSKYFYFFHVELQDNVYSSYNVQLVPLKNAESFSRSCTLVNKDSHDVKGMRISRSYTPVIPALKADEEASDGKTVHLMIKIYPDGALTPLLKALEIGDKVDMKDTEGDFELSTLQRQININLVTFNKTVRDIIWKEELDRLQEQHNRLRVQHILSEPDDSWEGARGRVRSELLEPLLPEDIRQSDSLLVCICGPLPFTKAAVKCLEDLQCPSTSVHAFLG